VVAVGAAVGVQCELAAVQAAGGGRVDRGQQPDGDAGAGLASRVREDVEHGGGDGEAGQPRDRGGE
jgi:hypothetical protein